MDFSLFYEAPVIMFSTLVSKISKRKTELLIVGQVKQPQMSCPQEQNEDC